MKNEITYTEINGLYYPDLKLPKQPEVSFGKYGQMRLEFLKKHRRGTYTTLVTQAKLGEHLSEIDLEARAQVNLLTSNLAKSRGIDEILKATDPLRWVREMNSCKTTAENIVIKDIIYG